MVFKRGAIADKKLLFSVKILALADADAYGLDIVSVYKHGSMQLQHENEKLAAERVEWIGVSAVEAIRYGYCASSLCNRLANMWTGWESIEMRF